MQNRCKKALPAVILISLIMCVLVLNGCSKGFTGTPGVTKENFDYIEDGMSYEQVVEAMGKEGQPVSIGADYNEKTDSATSYTMWGWSNSDGSVIINVKIADEKGVIEKKIKARD